MLFTQKMLFKLKNVSPFPLLPSSNSSHLTHPELWTLSPQLSETAMLCLVQPAYAFKKLSSGRKRRQSGFSVGFVLAGITVLLYLMSRCLKPVILYILFSVLVILWCKVKSPLVIPLFPEVEFYELLIYIRCI